MREDLATEAVEADANSRAIGIEVGVSLSAMPRLYNIPEWYDGEYEKGMLDAVSEIDRLFPRKTSVGEAYLQALRQSNSSEHRGHLDFYLSGAEPIWSGENWNVGLNVIKVRDGSAFRWILPAYMLASILVHESGPSEAEDGVMPWLLAERLRPPRMSLHMPAFLSLFDGYEPNQLATIRKVLELIARRNDDTGEAARDALGSYWKDVPVPPSL